MKPAACAWLVPFGACALLALTTGCSDSSAKKKTEAPPVPVLAERAVARDIPVELQIVGRAEAFESVQLKSRVDGQVAEVRFTEGQHVQQGDVLIRLDPTDLAARLAQAEATAARDAALLAKMRADTARYAALRERNFVSEEKVNEVRTNEAAAAANLRASQANADFARLQLGYATIRAPFSGIVGARLVFPGSAVKVNDTLLAVVNRVRPLLVAFALPEKHLARVREAMREGRMPVSVAIPGGSGTFSGQVRFVDNAVDPATGTIQMKAELANDEEKLTPGQFLNVTLRLDTLEKAVVIPSPAVQQGADGNFAFVVKEDQSVEVRKFRIVAAHDGWTAVSQGIAPGETVVTDGQLRLLPGSRVKLRDAAGAGAKAGETAASADPAKPGDAAKPTAQ